MDYDDLGKSAFYCRGECQGHTFIQWCSYLITYSIDGKDYDSLEGTLKAVLVKPRRVLDPFPVDTRDHLLKVLDQPIEF